MDDAIRINGIRGYGYTGFFDAEQELGQWFEVDLRISVDLSRCGDDDALAHTVDYSQVVQRVQTLLETSRCRTIERLATLVCEAVLTFPPCSGWRPGSRRWRRRYRGSMAASPSS
jgi:7,8-dihydroneopterin aldolase/epimerase/oxygenase